MVSLLANFDIEKPKNFWKLYPSWKTPKVLKELYLSDKSNNKVQSSTIMWAIIHMFDKTAYNPWRNYDIEDKLDVINTDIVNDKKFHWDKYSEVMDEVKKTLLDPMERMYYSLVEKMDQRTRMLKDATYTIEDAKAIDDIYLRTDKLRIELNKMKEALEGKDEDGRGKGGLIESAGEKGEI